MIASMTYEPGKHRDLALNLLTNVFDLNRKEAGFLGHVVVTKKMTARQDSYLMTVLQRHARRA